MKLYRHDHGEVRPGANANDGLYFYGVAKAEAFVQALYKAGKNPTRAGLMNALLSMNYDEQFAAPGRHAEDVEDGPLHHQPDAAPAVQRDTGSGCRSGSSSRVARAKSELLPACDW